MNKFVKPFLIATILLLGYNVPACFSQENSARPVLPQPIPPSPIASSLGKYGDIPVGLYTGLPEISIPLYQVKEGDIDLPISLSYHASGVRVEDNASWVGLGWALNAGGVITRTVRNRTDEQGYFASYPKIPNILLNPKAPSTLCEEWDAMKYAFRASGGEFALYDSEPDVYFFNFNGFSGKFVFDQNGVPYTIPYQKIKIEKTSLTDWIITTIDGTKYKFGGTCVEYSNTWSVSYPYYGWPVSDKNKTEVQAPYISSWYLREIESPTGNKITFQYEKEEYEVNSGISQEYYYAAISTPGPLTPSVSSIFTKFDGLRLSQINYSNGNIKFIATKPREDLSLYNSTPKSNVLEKIIVNTTLNTPIKQFVLNTDYFTTIDAVQNAATKRLRLNSVKEYDGMLTTSNPPYVFTYDETYKLPAKNSSSQDHWGYYNGQNNIDANGYPVLVPNIQQSFMMVTMMRYGVGTDVTCSNCPVVECPDPNSVLCVSYNTGIKNFTFVGANREPNFNYAKTGILTKIKYPTGGYTSFEYEPHDYDLRNYIYKKGSAGSDVLASCYDPNKPSTHDGNKCYVTKNINPVQLIPAKYQAGNALVAFNITLTYNLDGNDNRCCKCSAPYSYLKDVTTGETLLAGQGFSGVQTISSSIQEQINLGTIEYSHSSNNTYFNFKNVMLDASHTYELYAATFECPPERCGENPGCPANQSARMEGYIAANFTYNTDEVETYNGISGGMRIKRISSYPFENSTNPLIKSYIYRTSDIPGNLKSSGVLIDNPVYMETYERWEQQPFHFRFGMLTYSNELMQTMAYFLTSGSKFELGQTGGSYIGYSEVQEIYCPDSTCDTLPIGKKIFKYTTAKDYPDKNTLVFGYVFYSSGLDSPCPGGTTIPNSSGYRSYMDPTQASPYKHYFPYPQKNSYDWKRGLITNELTYDKDGILRKEVAYKYNSVDEARNQRLIPGLKITHGPGGRPQDMYYGRYDHVAGWNYKTEEKTTEYGSTGNNNMVTTVGYFYDNPEHAQLSRTEYINSKGYVVKKTTKFPLDYTGITATDQVSIGVKVLQDRFVVNKPIEQTTSVNGAVTLSTFQTYRSDNAQADQMYVAENSNPLTDFATSSVQGGAVRKDARYQPVVIIDAYDAKGNIREMHKANDRHEVYFWGYNSMYPVAKIIGADYNSAAQYVNQTLLDNLSTTDDQMRTAVNNLRLNLPKAEVTTFTYNPAVGMTSQTDPSGKISYFEYDKLGRLVTIKDQGGKIIKQYNYQFQAPVPH